MASSIDAVTASFATSLALAGDDVVDISRLHGSAPLRISQSLLLAKPLTAKPYAASDLQRHFRRVWVLDGRFKVQERAHNNFVFAFDLRKDRNRVLWGGPWYFNRAPMIIQEYDGLMAPGALRMDSLSFWVRIENIPPTLEVKQTIINVASVAGKFLDFDKKLFDNTGKIRVRVSHEISRPFFLKRTLKLAPGIVEEISYFFENLNGVCPICHLLFHENGTCRMATQSDLLQDDQMKEGKKLDLPNPFQSVANGMFHNGTFRFKGIQTPILPPLARNLFGTKDVPKQRKPVILHSAQLKNSGVSDRALVLVPFDEAQVLPRVHESQQSLKRGRPSSPFASPKKLKFLLNAELERKGDTCMPLKKIKIPAMRFTAKSLGLIEAPGGMLVPAEVAMAKEGTQTEQAATKKKRGRPLGSRNKNPPKSKKVSVEEVLSMLYSGKPPSPSFKGKEKF